MSDMTPALTPDQWATFPNWPDVPRPTFTGDAPLYFPSKHGIAAANLHREPFGFTHADVEALRKHSSVFIPEIEAQLVSLADRIAALLPPEPTP